MSRFVGLRLPSKKPKKNETESQDIKTPDTETSGRGRV